LRQDLLEVITSQFCIVLVNNDELGGREVPNANVNIEYGLMLGFNELVIPFQRRTQTLPFNLGSTPSSTSLRISSA